jgi:hypothetical protein
MQAFSAAGQLFYQAQAGEPAASGAEAEGETVEEPVGAPADEDVVEADYEIVDDDK